jgi:hypothetical protein
VTFKSHPSGRITVNPGESATVQVKFTPPSGSDASLFPIYSGYVTFSSDKDDRVARVPYAGVVGDWSKAPIWSRKSPAFSEACAAIKEYQALGYSNNSTASVGAYVENGSFTPITPNYNLNVSENSLILLAPASTTTRGFKVEAIYTGSDSTVESKIMDLGIKLHPTRAATSIPHVHTISAKSDGSLDVSDAPVSTLTAPVIQRNAPHKAQSLQPPMPVLWDGTVFANATSKAAVALPDGQYKLKFSALRHFRTGEDAVADWDIFETPSFNLVR